MTEPVLSVRDLARRFPIRKGVFSRTVGHVHALDGVSFDVMPGETLSLVGESGCGKSTTGRCIVLLDEADEGEVRFEGKPIKSPSARELKALRRRMQMIFQDPSAALTDHLTVREQLAEPLRNLADVTDEEEVERRIADVLERVGLTADAAERFPHQFSGGQKQRICIARALVSSPKLIVCDEAVSALDVSIQAQIVNLLVGLQESEGLGLLFISHDLGIVEAISHRVAVMYLGRIVEIGTTAEIFDAPRHPYTEALLAAAPLAEPPDVPRPERDLSGDVPSASNPPSGCHFRTRCPLAEARCAEVAPKLEPRAEGRLVACHLR